MKMLTKYELDEFKKKKIQLTLMKIGEESRWREGIKTQWYVVTAIIQANRNHWCGICLKSTIVNLVAIFFDVENNRY